MPMRQGSGNMCCSLLRRLTCLFVVASLVVASGSRAQSISDSSEVSALLRELDSASAKAKVSAISRLASYNAKALPAADRLFSLLNDEDAAVQQAATDTLTRLGTHLLPYLATKLRSRAAEERQLTIEILGLLRC